MLQLLQVVGSCFVGFSKILKFEKFTEDFCQNFIQSRGHDLNELRFVKLFTNLFALSKHLDSNTILTRYRLRQLTLTHDSDLKGAQKGKKSKTRFHRIENMKILCVGTKIHSKMYGDNSLSKFSLISPSPSL